MQRCYPPCPNQRHAYGTNPVHNAVLICSQPFSRAFPPQPNTQSLHIQIVHNSRIRILITFHKHLCKQTRRGVLGTTAASLLSCWYVEGRAMSSLSLVSMSLAAPAAGFILCAKKNKPPPFLLRRRGERIRCIDRVHMNCVIMITCDVCWMFGSCTQLE